MTNNYNDLSIEQKMEYTANHKFFNNRIVWLNSKEAAEYLRISVGNLRVKVSRGEISISGRLGRSLRFRREELDKLLVSSKKRSY
jgi:excisionase family DNA binding protein